MKKEGFLELKKRNSNVTKIEATRVVTANADDVGEATVEFHGDVAFTNEGEEYGIKIEIFTTYCSIQLQVKKLFADAEKIWKMNLLWKC